MGSSVTIIIIVFGSSVLLLRYYVDSLLWEQVLFIFVSCFSMPGEPVVILHVALVDGISASIQSIVRHPTLSNQSDFTFSKNLGEDTSQFDTAIFYSITSTQPGLQGLQ